MKRLITSKLINWSNSNRRKPLILKGARQTGKTFSVLEFGKKYISGKVHVVDFEKRPELNSIFEKNLVISRIVEELELVFNTQINIEEDLLFLDEIQNSPQALKSLRYFYENLPQLRVIAAGSLLEFALSEISFPVGRVNFATMHPMNFVEFLFATDKSLLAEKLLDGEYIFSKTIHNLLLDELKKYFFIGGMPEVVSEYVNSGKLQNVFEVQRDLLNSFRYDFTKYGKRIDPRALDSVLVGSVQLLGKQVKYSRISDYATSPTIKKAFELLNQANLMIKVPAVSTVGLPLGSITSGKKFKAIFLDIGLAQNLSGIPVDFEYRKNNLMQIYNGALAEQFVGQELISCGYQLYYWARDKRGSTAEIDFLTVKGNNIIPIEVKSGNSGKLKSMHLFLKSYPDYKTGYILQQTEFTELNQQKLKFIPIYAACSFIQAIQTHNPEH